MDKTISMKLTAISTVITLTLAANALAAPMAKPMKLAGADSAFHVSSMNLLDGKNKLCITGSYFDADELKTFGKIVVLDNDQGKILWQKKVAAPQGYPNEIFTDCRLNNGAIYIAANVGTNSSPPLNQDLAYVYKFNETGKLEGQKQYPATSRNAYTYGLELINNDLTLIGVQKDEDDVNEYYAMYSVKVDSNLNLGEPLVQKTGAYAPYTKIRLIDNSLFTGGNFLASKVSKSDLPQDYANSKIRPGAKYVWSTRPLHIDASNIATAISSNGTVYSIGYQGAETTVATVDADGKITATEKYSGKFCKTDSVTALGDTLYAVRKTCGKSTDGSSLVSINPKSGAESPVDVGSAVPQVVFAENSLLNIILKDANGNLLFTTLAVKGGAQ